MTPAQQKAYYAKNKTDAVKKETDKDYELVGSRGDAARKGMAEGRMDAMGTAYKKGGKVMKKAKRYEEGGDVETETAQGQNKNIGDDVRARAMAAMEKGSSDEPAIPKKAAVKLTPKAEAPTLKAAPKAEPKATPVAKTGEEKTGFEAKKAKALEGTSVKTEAPTPKAEAPKEEKSFLKGTKGFKNFGDMFKSMRQSAGITSYKSGGKVKSASSRADGCAIRGKTRA
jgi:hypothetical protein